MESGTLRFAEELILLLIDKEHGDLAPVPDRSLRCALAGSVLMDLALEDRIDSDMEHLFLVDSTPVGDDLLDRWLKVIGSDSERRDTSYWVERIAEPDAAYAIRDRVVDRLVALGILEQQSESLFSMVRGVARSRRYPMVDGTAEQEVETRVMGVLFNHDLPSPRDVMLISLVHACGIFQRLLSPGERAEVAERLDLISRLDLLGRSVFHVIAKAGEVDAGGRDLWVRGAARPAMRVRALAAQPLADGGGMPVAGNAFKMGGNLISFLTEQYQKLGPVFRVRAFALNYTVLAGPEANQLYQRRGREYFRTFNAYSALSAAFSTHRLILATDGAEHYQLRKMLKNGYSGTYALQRVAQAADIATSVVGTWPKGRPFKANFAIQQLIGEQIAGLCTGVSPEGYADDLAFYLDRLISVRILRQRPEWMLKMPRARRGRAGLEALCDRVLEAHTRERRAGKEPDLIDDILELHRSDPHIIPEQDLISLCAGPFIAGLHTVAAVTTFMLYSVLRHADVRARLQPEIDALFANGGPTPEKFGALDVTRRVAMETMRMYPIAPVAIRQAINTFEFAGHTVPYDTPVMIATSVPHRLAEHYPDPERFDIDRYTPERAEHRAPGVYAPFGLGTHRCLGDRFAQVLLGVTLATVLRRADLVLDPPDYRMKVRYSGPATPPRSFRIKVLRHLEGD